MAPVTPEEKNEINALIDEARTAIDACNTERNRWKTVTEALSVVLSADTSGDGTRLNGKSSPVLSVRIEKDSENSLIRAGKNLSPFAVLVSVAALVLTTCQVQNRIDELNATTVYNLSKEGRQLGRQLRNGDATVGEALSFHYSAYYMQEKGLVEDESKRFMRLDLCEFTKNAGFKKTWDELKKFYPTEFRTLIEAMRALSECSLESVDGLSTIGEKE